MRRRTERKRRERDAALAAALEHLKDEKEQLYENCCILVLPDAKPPSIDWSALPPSLDPLSKHLTKMTKIGRAERKRQQLESLAFSFRELVREGDVIVDLGCGQGHVGLLLAYLHPSCSVILLDNNPDKIKMCEKRLESLPDSLKRRVTTMSSISELEGKDFDVGVGLHCCGKLTDIAIGCCTRAGARFCISPCCYGQVGASFCEADAMSWAAIARGADFNVGPAHAFDPACDAFTTAKMCMNLIDVYRVRPLRAAGYSVSVHSMMPLTQSPKNNIVIGNINTG